MSEWHRISYNEGYNKGHAVGVQQGMRIDQALEQFALLVHAFTSDDTAGHMQYLHEQAENALAYRALIHATDAKYYDPK